MSKSYGNYIGISEPPQEIYGKIMSISDELMWRYYELLTDVKVPEIEQMKADASTGKQHPMRLKKALARRIVQDFHGEEAAAAADENWARQFQKDEVPENVESQTIVFAEVRSGSEADQSPYPGIVKMDKLIVKAGLADSATDAQRKRKQNAVKIDEKIVDDHALIWNRPLSDEFILKVGRKIKRIKFI
jgi:tyrosyl-tRNA synthetase